MPHTIRVEHRDGTTDTLGHIESEIDESFGKMTQARLVTTRREVDSVALSETDDEVFLDDETGATVFGGVLRDVDRESANATLTVDSMERYALDAEPTPAGTRYQNVADTTIIDDAIAAIPQVTAGTVESLAAGLTFVFNHSTRANQLRTVADTTGARVRYNADKTVDYVDRHGTDRDELLSPETQTTVDRLRVTRKGSDGQRNKLRMLGVGEGVHQRQATVTADGYDPAADREKWRVYKNKSFTDTDTLRQQGEELLAEMEDAWLEVGTTARADALGAPIALGDTFPVRAERKGLDDRLQVVDQTRKIDPDGERSEVTLSSRIQARETAEEKSRADIERFNSAFEGTPVAINTSGGRNRVSASESYAMKLYYPAEVKYEHRMEVRVIGLGYRTDSRFTSQFPAGRRNLREWKSQSGDITLTDSSTWDIFDSIFLENDYTALTAMGWMTNNGDSPRRPDIRLWNDTEDIAAPKPGGVTPDIPVGETRAFHLTFPTVAEGDNMELQLRAGGSANEGPYNVRMSWSGMGHTHLVDPGIRDWGSEPDPDFGALYPRDCNVVVNGTPQGTAFGDGTGEFEGTVDIRGELNPGQVNEIKVDSASRGDLIVYAEGDAYRQVMGGG